MALVNKHFYLRSLFLPRSSPHARYQLHLSWDSVPSKLAEDSIWTLSLLSVFWRLRLCYSTRLHDFCHRLTDWLGALATEHLLFGILQHVPSLSTSQPGLVIGVLFIFRVSMLPASLSAAVLYYSTGGRVASVAVCACVLWAGSVSPPVRTWILSSGEWYRSRASASALLLKGQQPLQGQVYWQAPSFHQWSRLDARRSYVCQLLPLLLLPVSSVSK